MGKVTVNINNRTFQIACEDGEEARLKELASFFLGTLISCREGSAILEMPEYM